MSENEHFETAISALFGLCAPAVSDGVLARTFPVESLVPMTNEEKVAHLAERVSGASYWRTSTADRIVIVESTQSHCRVMTGGDPMLPKSLFLEAASKDGWHVNRDVPQDNGSAETIGAMFDVSKNRKIVISFTVHFDKPDSGFFASAFQVQKGPNDG